MDRRTFLGTLALSLRLLAPLAAEAQTGKVPRIGVLSPGFPGPSPLLDAFRQGLRELGYVEGQSITIEHRTRILDLAAKHRLPAAPQYREFAQAGGLLSYAPSLPDMFRRAATYVDRILKGAKPADLPVEQPTTFELVINMRTARALGLTIPPSILLRADRVLE